MFYVDTALSMTGCTIPTVLYALISKRILQMRASVTRELLERRLCIQFILILVVYLLLSASFIATTVLPDIKSLRYITSFLGTVNFSTTPVVYLVFNQQIRRATKAFWCCQDNVDSALNSLNSGRNKVNPDNQAASSQRISFNGKKSVFVVQDIKS